MCVSVCVFVFAHVCIMLFTGVCVCVHIHMYVNAHLASGKRSVCLYMYVCMYVYIHECQLMYREVRKQYYSHFHNDCLFFSIKKTILIPNAEIKDRTGAFWVRNSNLSFLYQEKKRQSLRK